MVSADDVVLEVETDKTAIAAPSPIAGKVIEILVEDGDTVVAGQDLYVVADGADAGMDASAPAAAPAAAKAPEPVAEEAAKEVSTSLGAAPSVGSTPTKVEAPVVKPVAKAAPAAAEALPGLVRKTEFRPS